MRVVVALGGNALQQRNDPPGAGIPAANLRVAVEAVAQLAREHEVVVTHGNGPQVGMLAMAAAAQPGAPAEFDVLVAESEGMIGYLLERELKTALPEREVATLLTQVEVDAKSPAFAAPTKPVGPIYAETEARRLAAERHWSIMRDGAGFRRCVPSPEPRRILEIGAIRILVAAGALVICNGGGGIPVVVEPDHAIRGVEGVIDKDLSAALLAGELDADALLLLTDVAAVAVRWGDPASPLIAAASPDRMRGFSFAPGSMAPKVEAACRFVERGGGFAGIGALAEARAILERRAGTIVERGRGILRHRLAASAIS